MRRDGRPTWSFLTNHAQVLLCIAHDPGVRLREIGTAVGITERGAHRIVAELAAAGYVLRTRRGRRNHYTIQSHLPLPDPLAREQKIGDLVAVLARHDPLAIHARNGRPDRSAGATARQRRARPHAD